MPISSRIYGPTSVELGKTGTGRISVICWNVKGLTPLKYGIGYKKPGGNGRKSSWHGWKNYTASVMCDQQFEFTFEVTKDMLDKQKAGNSLFIYSCDGMADRLIEGVGKGRYSYFAVTKPGVVPIGGRVFVVTSSRRKGGRKKILYLNADEYKSGRIYQTNDKYGGARAGPDYKIFRESMPEIWGQLTYIRKSYFDTLSKEEQDWLIEKGKIVVPADWTPADGAPIPTYQLTGAFTAVPDVIPISPVPGWGVKLMVDTLPVSFDLQAVSCTDILGNAVTPPNIAGRIPVMFSVDGATIASLAPASSVSIDLASLFSLWSTALTMGVNAITLTAQTATTTIDGVLVPGISVSRTIPVSETIPITEEVCTEGEKRRPLTCWDRSQVMTEVCRDDTWVPSGEECPPRLPERSIMMATPKIAYEGQAIDFVVQAFCGAALSQGEPATLTIDGVDVQTKTTSAGEVRFRWTATGVGMRRVCVNIPKNPNCPIPGRVCESMMVSAYVEGIKEQIKREKAAYDAELARLRRLKEAAKAGRSRLGVPGTVRVPSTLAGMVIEVGGVLTTVPEGGIAVQVPPGESVITVVVEGIRKNIPVVVLPGETIQLPKIP